MKKRLISFLLLAGMCGAVCTACHGRVAQYKVKVLKEYSHDTAAYTQGLFFEEGQMYESTGQYGKSSFRVVDYKSGKVSRKLDFARKYFGEGSVMLDGKLFILTWTNKVAFVYDAATLKYEKTYSYPREGWGLTTDGEHLIASDGSSRIYYMTKEFKLVKTLDVRLDGRPVRLLNELELIDGKIWANVYMTDMIVVINPSDGRVEAAVDCSGLLPDKLRTPDTDVLNGIAYDKKTGKIWLTGKNWPRLYEVELMPVK